MSSEPSSTIHVPVLPTEVIDALRITSQGIYVDGTIGGGGHAELVASQLDPDGLLIGLDQDLMALNRCETRLSGKPVILAHSNFCELPEVLEQINVGPINGILLDLGLSSDQLEDTERGFSFNSTGPLDLRFNTASGEPAWRLIQRLRPEHLANLIYEFGEERLSRRIARKLSERSKKIPLKSAKDIADVICSCYPHSNQKRIHPATRTFQALRIAVNNELKSLEIALRRLPDLLTPSGIFAIISFHSLEDRRVKHAFREDKRLEVITKRPIVASPEEVDSNPRSRSAKLRVAQRI
ncbi:MAG: 16S rRNA (cytosine(1402)-N(4))-methyltransferase RsmH [Planctomycetaceae bacterium]|jgi:16S rRNA (cytosine1402-N4)-methyltransferase|nr:16S rRNA (cytosine(1402)-N(4))-methyltransferase RsmH [Planctomycetaceae bacterium]